jgi:hypothetical protein
MSYLRNPSAERIVIKLQLFCHGKGGRVGLATNAKNLVRVNLAAAEARKARAREPFLTQNAWINFGCDRPARVA